MFVYNEYNGLFRPGFPSYILNRNQNNETGDWIVREGIPEKDLIEWTRQFMRADSDFVDIGAHMGTYTINLAPLCRNVHCFEPQRKTFYQLCGGISLNNLDNVYAYNVALGNQGDSGTYKTLNVFSEDGGGSTLVDEVAKIKYEKQIISSEYVKLKTLDDYKLDNVSFIKIDAEGYESEIIAGAFDTIERNRPGILFECWDDQWYEKYKNKTFTLLNQLNYDIFPIIKYSSMFLAVPKK